MGKQCSQLCHQAAALTDGMSGSRLAGAEHSPGGIAVLINRRQGYHFTCYAPDGAVRIQDQRLLFPTRYDLLVLARASGFAEVDAEAIDWCAMSGSVEKDAHPFHPSSL